MRLGVALLVKVLIFAANLGLMVGGGWLMWTGVSLATNEEFVNYGWLLPMRYKMPVFYYSMFGVTLVGVLFSGLSLLGCVSAYTQSRLLLSLYVFSLSALLIGEAAALISASATPGFLGLRVDPEELTDSWQRFYAIPGREQYTAAIDFIQTNAECCGSVKSQEWTTSWWRLREYAPEGLVVPLSCCLSDAVATDLVWIPHLDPRPLNVTACQSEDEEVHGTARHTEGCAVKLASWLQWTLRKVFYFSLAAILYHLLLLLVTICGAVHIFSKT